MLTIVSFGLAPGVVGAQGGPPAALTPVAEVDIGSFSARAQAWTSARSGLRQAALDRADALAAEAKAAEEEAARVAAEEEAARVAAEEQAREQEEAARRAAEEEAARIAAEEEAARRAAEVEAARQAAATTTAAPSVTPPPGAGPTAAQWAVLRECESSGNYAAVNPNGRYRGAYQFSQGTWDWVAGMRAPELVGVDPAAASPAQQDALAYALYEMRGASPWPHCGGHLR